MLDIYNEEGREISVNHKTLHECEEYVKTLHKKGKHERYMVEVKTKTTALVVFFIEVDSLGFIHSYVVDGKDGKAQRLRAICNY